MTLNRFARPVESVFSLIGEGERAITDSLAWVLDCCPTFRQSFLKKLTGSAPKDVDLTVSTQTLGADAGFTDIEISGASALHLVLEAKHGWTLPDVKQLSRYAKRLNKNGLPTKRNLLVSASECSNAYAALHLPSSVRGISLKHVSWREVLKISERSRADASSSQEKGWLSQFIQYLKGIATMQDVQSNWVYVVSLSTEEIRKGWAYTWVDVVERDRCYFHPIDKTWPLSPPNYVAFRHHGHLQSIHHVEKYSVVHKLHTWNKSWPKTNRPHFVYELSRPVRPPLDIGLGNLYSNARVWCLIDTLLTGKYKTLKDAGDASRKRMERAGID